eukprot:g59062.t1
MTSKHPTRSAVATGVLFLHSPLLSFFIVSLTFQDFYTLVYSFTFTCRLILWRLYTFMFRYVTHVKTLNVQYMSAHVLAVSLYHRVCWSIPSSTSARSRKGIRRASSPSCPGMSWIDTAKSRRAGLQQWHELHFGGSDIMHACPTIILGISSLGGHSESKRRT